MTTPRLRMFASPNGSGKSTIKDVIPPELLGIYVNPDEIEKSARQLGYIDFEVFSASAAPMSSRAQRSDLGLCPARPEIAASRYSSQ